MSDEKRTHKQRLAKLREIFGRRQEVARQSGKKHDVSIAKICTDAGVDKVYLHGFRLKEDSPDRAEYIAFREEVLEFQKNLGAGVEQSDDKRQLEELKKRYTTLLSDCEPLQRELAYYKAQSSNDGGELDHNRQRMTQLLAKVAELENTIANTPKQGKVAAAIAARIQKHVVSPDNFRTTGGRYKLGSKALENEAWGNAYRKLEELLSRKLKMRLYVLVGLPCSGKSTWAEEGTVATDRHPVIFDAMNLSNVDRYRFVHSLSRFNDLPKVCVYLDTDMEVIRERNRTLRTAGKQMTDDDLTVHHSKLEKPDPYEERWIDELIVVRDHR
ncbi:ATP-binding protein [Undibacterium sp. Jales W-56]|uniref:ATP-binding protein n=1 Tax=Undibacterium sp. Jales W-56 TaxID=2897325 RepID=UPI0021D11EBE|nr:ATP-binding protein [Undibacterium sp. Jales W-56]MCU6434611.1 ATP-binding protein [Undibacterium sp. Jales W-56]